MLKSRSFDRVIRGGESVLARESKDGGEYSSFGGDPQGSSESKCWPWVLLLSWSLVLKLAALVPIVNVLIEVMPVLVLKNLWDWGRVWKLSENCCGFLTSQGWHWILSDIKHHRTSLAVPLFEFSTVLECYSSSGESRWFLGWGAAGSLAALVPREALPLEWAVTALTQCQIHLLKSPRVEWGVGLSYKAVIYLPKRWWLLCSTDKAGHFPASCCFPLPWKTFHSLCWTLRWLLCPFHCVPSLFPIVCRWK